MSRIRLELDVPDEYAQQVADNLDRQFVHRALDDIPLWTSATVVIIPDVQASG